MKETFEALALQHGWKYRYTEQRSVSLVSRNIPVSYHHLDAKFNGVDVHLVYEFGGNNMAQISSQVKTGKKIADFTVTTRSHIQRLFSKNKQAFKVHSNDPKTISFLVDLLDASSYHELVLNTTFEPEIRGESSGEYYQVKTIFYLGFNDKELSIVPSIELHRQIMDGIFTLE